MNLDSSSAPCVRSVVDKNSVVVCICLCFTITKFFFDKYDGSSFRCYKCNVHNKEFFLQVLYIYCLDTFQNFDTKNFKSLYSYDLALCTLGRNVWHRFSTRK